MKSKVQKSVVSEKEIDIQNAICDYLARKHYFFWRQNTGGMFREGRWFSQPKYSKNGVPDIILIKQGLFMGIEVKRKGGKQSPHQKAFQEECEKAGGQYHLVYDVVDIIKLGL